MRVVTAAQAAARDKAAITAGIPSSALMAKAGENAATILLHRFSDLQAGVAVFAGPGNNGGDAWVVAGVLSAQGIPVTVFASEPPRTGDAHRAMADALHRAPGLRVAENVTAACDTRPALVVDGLLGTGARGALRGVAAMAVQVINALDQQGAAVAALDVPTGVDATTGRVDGASVVADLTITFGTIKRGHLLARGLCGEIIVVDIGLGSHANLADGAPHLIDEGWVRGRVPPIPAESHKGIRRRITILGGQRGMAGAVTLAARSAFRSGVGMVRLIVEDESLAVVQTTVPEATAAVWPSDNDAASQLVAGYAHALLAGPGLGRGAWPVEVLERMLEVWQGPTVLDADALHAFGSDVPRLAAALGGRLAVLTPHAGEFGRLMGLEADAVMEQRFDLPVQLARSTGATVLLKGVPTVIAAPDGDLLVTATGTPALAVAGSGDLLAGVVVTLLAQSGQPLESAACGAWLHGRAAELANAGRPVRGVTLGDVEAKLAEVWDLQGTSPDLPVLFALPRVGDPPPTAATRARA